MGPPRDAPGPPREVTGTPREVPGDPREATGTPEEVPRLPRRLLNAPREVPGGAQTPPGGTHRHLRPPKRLPETPGKATGTPRGDNGGGAADISRHFKFKEYCPQVFRNLRERFGIDDQDYQASLTRSPPHAEGSDRRLLLSFDRTLVVKELSSEDVADVHGLLAHYHQYVVQCHGSTLLPRFLGMYRASVESEESYLLAMRNTFSHRLAVHRKYDLKGSLVSREASDKEKGKELPTLKDVDFLNKNEKVYVSEAAPPRQEVYFMGLIDVLTQYDARKKAAHAAKTVKHGVRGGAGRPPPQKKI
uniref:Phosphatidylinositol 5-phosphate 4-kinase type-2 gamma n=1 Tax=Anas zonorhyncha TaxID=75864 RepID=A0A8B9V729_9AVES